MDNEKISSIISLGVAILVLIISYFQWYDIRMGEYGMKKWVKIFLIPCIIALIVAIAFLFNS